MFFENIFPSQYQVNHKGFWHSQQQSSSLPDQNDQSQSQGTRHKGNTSSNNKMTSIVSVGSTHLLGVVNNNKTVRAEEILRNQLLNTQSQKARLLRNNQIFEDSANPLDRALDDRPSHGIILTSYLDIADFDDREQFVQANNYFATHPAQWNMVKPLVQGRLLFAMPNINTRLLVSLRYINEFVSQFCPDFVKPPSIDAHANGKKILIKGDNDDDDTVTSPGQLYFLMLCCQYGNYEFGIFDVLRPHLELLCTTDVTNINK